MASPKTYTIHLVVCDDPQTGIWCNGCRLPARVRFDLAGISERGVGPMGSVERCLHCDGYEDDDDDQ